MNPAIENGGGYPGRVRTAPKRIIRGSYYIDIVGDLREKPELHVPDHDCLLLLDGDDEIVLLDKRDDVPEGLLLNALAEQLLQVLLAEVVGAESEDSSLLGYLSMIG